VQRQDEPQGGGEPRAALAVLDPNVYRVGRAGRGRQR